jgi:signal transduction histidine kinase
VDFPRPDLGHGDTHVPDRFVFELVHDLRQPVAAISALVMAAETVDGIPQEVLHRLHQIQEESRRISSYIRQSLEGAIAPKPLDAGELALGVADTIEIAGAGTVKIVADPDAVVVADEAALRRVLANLLDNALRAAGPEGTVLVGVQNRGPWVCFDVHDSGPGFGEGPRGSYGLGLQIAERLASVHGGEITMLRSHLGGTLARLQLPAPAAAKQHSPPATSARP